MMLKIEKEAQKLLHMLELHKAIEEMAGKAGVVNKTKLEEINSYKMMLKNKLESIEKVKQEVFNKQETEINILLNKFKYTKEEFNMLLFKYTKSLLIGMVEKNSSDVKKNLKYLYELFDIER